MSYRFQQANSDSKSLILYVDLFRQAYDRSRHLNLDYLKWLYKDNPAGEVVGFDAFFSGSIAAHYVCIPVFFYFNGIETKGLLSLNTATHPQHQKKGLFVKLAKQTYQYARDNGFQFVVGVANAQSTHGFVDRLGFQLVRPLDAKIGIGFPGQTEIPAGFYQMQRVWNKQFLTWRMSNPSKTYRVDALPDDRLLIRADTGIAGIKAILYDSKSYDVDHQLAPVRPIINPVQLWIGIDPARKWGASCYFNLPQKLRLSPLNLIFKDLTGTKQMLHPEKIRFTGLDFDAY